MAVLLLVAGVLRVLGLLQECLQVIDGDWEWHGRLILGNMCRRLKVVTRQWFFIVLLPIPMRSKLMMN